MGSILVTGGCGYIGSHTVVDLVSRGYDVISIDNYYNAKKSVEQNIERITGKPFLNVNVDLKNEEETARFFLKYDNIDAIIHFAAYKSVEESTREPLLYHENNVGGLINLLKSATKNGIGKFIFSSSCTVYGQPEVIPVTEESPIKEAESPYGRTKQICEYILQDLARHKDFQVVLLRYFNPAGAHASGLIGEDANQKATNLVPVITETAIGKREEMVVFGDQYNTRDGSCIRDYIHIMDLANAHTQALEYIIQNPGVSIDIFNLGYGEGVTVIEAVKAFERVSGEQLNYRIGPPRDGDIVKIYSNNDKAERVLGWRPTRNIEEIMRSAWEWEKKRSAR